MPAAIHPILSEAYARADVTADRVSDVARLLLDGRATLDQLCVAVDSYRVASRELEQLHTLRLSVNGRTYTLQRRAAAQTGRV